MTRGLADEPSRRRRTAMPSFAIILCAIASVLGTLAVAPLAPDLRALADVGLIAFVLYAAFGRCGPPRFRALLAFALVGAAGDGTTELTLALESGPRVLARVRGVTPPAGTRVIVRGRLEPFDEPRNPDEPNERQIEAERGLDGQLEAATLLGVAAAHDWNANLLLARAHEWARARLQERLGEPAASLVAGELWGERAALPPALRSEFQETGTVHVLVTAGLHLGAVTALCLALLALLAFPRYATCAFAIALVWAFVWWRGAQLPAVRAAVMATAALTARACGRATLSWNALAIAALLIVLARPQSVATTSFALSFSCVGAIFACAAPIERWIEAHTALPDRAREAVVLSVATQLGIWPLGAAVFLQFCPYAV